jgi:RNA polymerase sigma-70 factor (ECF subfamily)
MTESTDEELVLKALAGSEVAAADIFRRYWTSTWRVAVGILGNRAAADDVAQDAMQRAFQALGQFDTTRPLGPWLHRIVVNCALDLLRSERRLALSESQETPDLKVDAGESSLPDDDLFRALRQLPPDRRAIVVLRYWLGYSAPEISDLLEIPVGTVSSRLSRALGDLRMELETNHGTRGDRRATA